MNSESIEQARARYDSAVQHEFTERLAGADRTECEEVVEAAWTELETAIRADTDADVLALVRALVDTLDEYHGGNEPAFIDAEAWLAKLNHLRKSA